MSGITLTVLNNTTSFSIRKRYLQYLNAFKNEYFANLVKMFNGAGAPLRDEYLVPRIDDGTLTMGFINYHNREVGCFELTLNYPNIGLATVYIKPEYRNRGIASKLYDYVERYATAQDKRFYIEIEEPNFRGYEREWFDRGFTHYSYLVGPNNKNFYNTFCLFRKPYSINMLPVWLPEIDMENS